MSLLNQNDGNPVSQGTEGQSPSPASPDQSQPLPDYVKDLLSQNASLVEQVQSLGTQIKGIQKGTDKQIGQVRGDIKRILELKEQGLNETQIQRELFVDSLMDGNAPVQKGSDTTPAKTTFDAEPLIKSLQFPDNDAGLAALRVKYRNDPQGLASAAADLRLQQLTSPNPSAATALPLSGGKVSGSVDVKAETQNYIQDMQGASGKGVQYGNAIKDKYRALGVPVDEITFRFS